MSGDTKKVPNMVRFSRGADLLVQTLNPDMVEMLASALDQTGNPRAGTMARQVIEYHTTPVEAAEIAKEAGVPHLVMTHMVPPLKNGLMGRMFLRGVAEARGPGDTMLGYDGLLITLPPELQGHPELLPHQLTGNARIEGARGAASLEGDP